MQKGEGESANERGKERILSKRGVKKDINTQFCSLPLLLIHFCLCIIQFSFLLVILVESFK